MKPFSIAAEKMREHAYQMPPHIREQIIADAERQALKDVFGVDHKTDRHGRPIEQGLGSIGNQTRQSVEAYEKRCRDEPDFDKNLARMKKELADCEARKEAEKNIG
jgi:hypothetical protein